MKRRIAVQSKLGAVGRPDVVALIGETSGETTDLAYIGDRFTKGAKQKASQHAENTGCDVFLVRRTKKP
jgi:hypothetical protein